MRNLRSEPRMSYRLRREQERIRNIKLGERELERDGEGRHDGGEQHIESLLSVVGEDGVQRSGGDDGVVSAVVLPKRIELMRRPMERVYVTTEPRLSGPQRLKAFD